VNAKEDASGWNALHYAAIGGHKEIAELLIAKGADVNAMNGIGKTPLDLAIGSRLPGETDGANRLKHPEIADLLRQHGGKTLGELLSN
jgi:ankyrin repeat protein